MTHITDAVYSDGVFKPQQPIGLKNQARVRLIVLTIDEPSEADRAEVLREFREGVAGMSFHSNGAYPRREELHERG